MANKIFGLTAFWSAEHRLLFVGWPHRSRLRVVRLSELSRKEHFVPKCCCNCAIVLHQRKQFCCIATETNRCHIYCCDIYSRIDDFTAVLLILVLPSCHTTVQGKLIFLIAPVLQSLRSKWCWNFLRVDVFGRWASG